MSAEQSQQSLAGPGKWRDFTKPRRDFFHITWRSVVKPKEKIVSAEQSQQSLAGPEKQKDFAKPPDESRWSENPITNRGGMDRHKRTVTLYSLWMIYENNR